VQIAILQCQPSIGVNDNDKLSKYSQIHPSQAKRPILASTFYSGGVTRPALWRHQGVSRHAPTWLPDSRIPTKMLDSVVNNRLTCLSALGARHWSPLCVCSGQWPPPCLGRVMPLLPPRLHEAVGGGAAGGRHQVQRQLHQEMHISLCLCLCS
jgi:hypothetical protein